MPQFCNECGAVTEPGRKFCTGCGAKIEAGVPVMATVAAPAYQGSRPPPPPPIRQPQHAPQPVYAQQQPMPAQPALGGAESISMFGYIGYLIIMSLPVLGIILSIVFGVNKTPSNKRNLARAMIVINVLAIILAVASAIMMYIALAQLSETLGTTINLFDLEMFQ